MSLKIVNIIVVLMVVLFSLAILANSMTKALGHDEQMYCTGGVLLAQGKMVYRDFSYIAQMPYHPLLFAAVYKITGTSQYLLVGRIISSICDILVVICIIAIFRSIFKFFQIAGSFLGLLAAGLYLFNPLVDYSNGFAWNHDVVVLCILFSFWLFISIDFTKKTGFRRIVAIGAILTLASCMRITTALVQLLFLILLLTGPNKSVKERLKITVAFLIPTVLVAIWPLITLILSPRAFFLNLFYIPALNAQFLREIGMVFSKRSLTFVMLTQPGYFVLIVMAVYCFVIIIRQYGKSTIANKKRMLLATALPVLLLVIAYLPPTMWRQYLAVPVPFLIISFASPLLYLRELAERKGSRFHFTTASVIAVVCLFISVQAYPLVFSRIPKLFDTQAWAPLQVHKISQDICERTKTAKRILTLAPLYALQGGCDIYSELSAGPFVYRVADFMSPADRKLTHSAGPETIKKLIEKHPPSAVIVGTEPDFLEKPILEIVVKPDWEKKSYDNGVTAYFSK